MRIGRRATLTPGVAVALPVVLSAVLLSACAVDPVQYRVTAQVMDDPFLSGAHATVEAVRTEQGWTVRDDRRGASSRWLSAADGARLDGALASGALYEKPTDVAGGCLDPGLATGDAGDCVWRCDAASGAGVSGLAGNAGGVCCPVQIGAIGTIRRDHLRGPHFLLSRSGADKAP